MIVSIWENAQVPSATSLEYTINPPDSTKEVITECTIPRAIQEVSDGPILVDDKNQSPEKNSKEILKKIIESRTQIKTTNTKGIVTQYGSVGQAIIHPPSSFNLPDMLIHILHYEKHSTFGSEDAILICLWQETPKGQMFVPSAFVHDNPKATKYYRQVFAGIPFAKNIQLVKREELQILIHGNKLFCGWTVPLVLLPQSLVLQPACVILEGYGSLKTRSFTVSNPSGYTTTHEYNGLEAFVTFLNLESQYSGAGTDGFLGVDAISTTIRNNLS